MPSPCLYALDTTALQPERECLWQCETLAPGPPHIQGNSWQHESFLSTLMENENHFRLIESLRLLFLLDEIIL